MDAEERNKWAAEFNAITEELLRDIELRADFQFEDTWRKMQNDPLLNSIIEPRMLGMMKKLVRHGYIAGAASGVLLMLEKVANEISE